MYNSLRLNGCLAEICTPFSHAQANGTRRNPGYSFNTTAKVTHLKNKVIGVCFLTLETLGGLQQKWANTIKTEQQAKKNMQHLPAQNSHTRGLTEDLAEIYTPGDTLLFGGGFSGGGGGSFLWVLLISPPMGPYLLGLSRCHASKSWPKTCVLSATPDDPPAPWAGLLHHHLVTMSAHLSQWGSKEHPLRAVVHSAGTARTARARRAHYRDKLGIFFATIDNILASVDHTTPPQCCTT